MRLWVQITINALSNAAVHIGAPIVNEYEFTLRVTTRGIAVSFQIRDDTAECSAEWCNQFAAND